MSSTQPNLPVFETHFGIWCRYMVRKDELCNPCISMDTYFVSNFQTCLKQQGFSPFTVSSGGNLSVLSAVQMFLGSWPSVIFCSCSFLYSPSVEDSTHMHFPDTVLCKTPCCWLKQSQPWALKSSLPNVYLLHHYTADIENVIVNVSFLLLRVILNIGKQE